MLKFSAPCKLTLALAAGFLVAGFAVSPVSAAPAYDNVGSVARVSSKSAASASSTVKKVHVDAGCTTITADTASGSAGYLADKNPDPTFGTTFVVMYQIIVPTAPAPVHTSAVTTELASGGPGLHMAR